MYIDLWIYWFNKPSWISTLLNYLQSLHSYVYVLLLQGKFGQEAMQEVSQMISDINLVDKTNSQSSKLSGGMKRKLRCIK